MEQFAGAEDSLVKGRLAESELLLMAQAFVGWGKKDEALTLLAEIACLIRIKT
jgi:hypothetical protein